MSNLAHFQMNECCEKMEKYCLQYVITQHHLELLLEYSKSHSFLPDSLKITLKTAITNGLVYEMYQRCKHHGKFSTIQMILCLPNKSMIFTSVELVSWKTCDKNHKTLVCSQECLL